MEGTSVVVGCNEGLGAEASLGVGITRRHPNPSLTRHGTITCPCRVVAFTPPDTISIRNATGCIS